MVAPNNRTKVGFIVEGGSEKIIVESEQFKILLANYGYELVTPVIDAEGGGNLLPQNIDAFIDRFAQKEVEQIFVLTDLEDEENVQVVRQRIEHQSIDFSFVAVKALEAWYLADSNAMNHWLGCDDFHEEFPEKTINKPWDRLREIAEERGARSTGRNKIAFAKRMSKHWGFSVEQAAQHPSCPSASELVNYFTQGIADAD
ncbi:MAG: hypothetical protein CMF25_06915 [Kangiellaceae bacterium]|nr:hypothetical protein [Kangiellaceae bacterium]|tara:strand:- start:1795 stop:2397 length:603 start_codon:yes stop_codon:yes gene_type:complete